MARTHGHGNPDWTRDETILALALYFDCNDSVPSKNDPRVQELSALLQRLPYHAPGTRRESFRNLDGVTFKMHNLRSVATGKGLKNTSNMDRKIWAEFGGDRIRTKEVAELIRLAVSVPDVQAALGPNDGLEEFFEGRILTQFHNKRERSPLVRKSLLKARKKLGPLACDLCSIRSVTTDPKFEDALFEAHHLLPLSMALARKTRIDDMALLCANCHRLVHRAIASERRWLDLDGCRKILRLAPRA